MRRVLEPAGIGAAGVDLAERAVRCTHCGLDVPPRLVRPADPVQFCCHGCRTVYAVLVRLGQLDYYRIRAADAPACPVPARMSGRGFEDFDHASFLASHARETPGGTRRADFFLEGVHCAACVWLVERVPAWTPGVLSVRLDLPRSRVEVEWDPAVTPLSAVARAFDALGYAPHAWRSDDVGRLRRAEDRVLLTRLGVAAACAMNVMLVQAALYAGDADVMEPGMRSFFQWVTLALTVPVMGYSARPFFQAAWAGLRRGVPHIDLPISLALAAAFAFSVGATVVGEGTVWFDSIAALVAALLGARYLQARARRAAMERAEALRGAAFVEFARRLDDGAPHEVPATELRPGDTVEVRSGELVPADGVVREGRSAVDAGVLTGEPAPLPVEPGATVLAGSTNQGARLVIEVVAAGEATRVGGLLRLVERASAERPPIVALTDRWSRWFVGAVLALAAVAMAVTWSESPAAAVARAIAMLVVTCPCALAMGTPIAVTIALSRAARRGIFIKNPDVLERMSGIRIAVLDKTGTLTTGRLAVAHHDLDAATAERVASLEAESVHPVATALRASFARTASPAQDVREVPGRGIAGRVDGVELRIGNRAFLADEGVETAGATARADALAARGLTPLLVAVDGRLAGVIGIGDTLRPEARAVVDDLRRRGWRPVLASGDAAAAVQFVAAELGIPARDAHGGMSPEDKLALVRELSAAAGRRVLMVGDGVNDAAALALADVGISVAGGLGPSLAASRVVLTRAGLEPLSELAEGAARTMGVIRRNLAISLAYNALGAAAALAGWITPLAAAVLMPLSSLAVILSSVAGPAFAARKAG